MNYTFYNVGSSLYQTWLGFTQLLDEHYMIHSMIFFCNKKLIQLSLFKTNDLNEGISFEARTTHKRPINIRF